MFSDALCFGSLTRPFIFHSRLADQISRVQVPQFKAKTPRIPILVDPNTEINVEKKIGEKSLHMRSIRPMPAFSSASPYSDSTSCGGAKVGSQSLSIERVFIVRDRCSKTPKMRATTKSVIFTPWGKSRDHISGSFAVVSPAGALPR
jgi:hypothetical protein